MKIEQIENENIPQIRSMWEELNKLHGHLSTHFKEHFESFTFEERLRQFKNKDSFAVFVAKYESNIAGYCMASVNGKIGEIDSIFINPQHRSKKVGEALIVEAESWLKKKSIIKIHIFVAEGNESVFSFYNKQGYQQRFTVLEKKP